MIQRIDVHLDRPLCEHLPTDSTPTWRWYFTQSTDDARQKRIEVHVYCKVCKRRDSFVQSKIPMQFMLRGKPASDQEAPFFVDESVQQAEAVTERTKRVTHEREFTPYDRAICKKLGIKYEGE